VRDAWVAPLMGQQGPSGSLKSALDPSGGQGCFTGQEHPLRARHKNFQGCLQYRESVATA